MASKDSNQPSVEISEKVFLDLPLVYWAIATVLSQDGVVTIVRDADPPSKGGKGG